MRSGCAGARGGFVIEMVSSVIAAHRGRRTTVTLRRVILMPVGSSVLPSANMSGDLEQDYSSDGITEDTQ